MVGRRRSQRRWEEMKREKVPKGKRYQQVSRVAQGPQSSSNLVSMDLAMWWPLTAGIRAEQLVSWKPGRWRLGWHAWVGGWWWEVGKSADHSF